MKQEVTIRHLTAHDLQFLLEVRNECREQLHDNREFTLKDTIEWYTKTNPDFYIIENKDKEMVGYVRTSNNSVSNKSITIGLDIHSKFRRRGYAYSAYLVLVDYIFQLMNYNRVDLEVLSTNTPAILLYEKIGFKYEGLKREAIIRNGQYIDSILMSILRKEWTNAHYGYIPNKE